MRIIFLKEKRVHFMSFCVHISIIHVNAGITEFRIRSFSNFGIDMCEPIQKFLRIKIKSEELKYKISSEVKIFEKESLNIPLYIFLLKMSYIQ